MLGYGPYFGQGRVMPDAVQTTQVGARPVALASLAVATICMLPEPSKRSPGLTHKDPR